MKKAVVVFAALFCAFGLYGLLFRPVPASMPADCDCVFISTYGPVSERFAVADADGIGRWTELLDSVKFRKSYRLSKESPENLWADVQFQNGGVSAGGLLLAANPYGAGGRVYFWNGREELVASRKETYGQIVSLLEDFPDDN